jgi:hypothetical protein
LGRVQRALTDAVGAVRDARAKRARNRDPRGNDPVIEALERAPIDAVAAKEWARVRIECSHAGHASGRFDRATTRC